MWFVTVLLPKGISFPTPGPPGRESLSFSNTTAGRLPFPYSLSHSKQSILQHSIAGRPSVVTSHRPSPVLFSLMHSLSEPHTGISPCYKILEGETTRGYPASTSPLNSVMLRKKFLETPSLEHICEKCKPKKKINPT